MRSSNDAIDSSIQLESLEGNRKSSTWLLYVLLVIGIVMAALVLLLLVKKIAFQDHRGIDGLSVAPQRSVEELNAEASAVYHAFAKSGAPRSDLGDDEASTLREVESLIARLEQLTTSEDEEGLRELIDVDRLLHRIELTGGMQGWSDLDKRMVKSTLKSRVGVADFAGEIHIAGVIVPTGDRDSRVVYTYREGADGEYSEDRLWIAKSGDEWKIYDWERLDLGLAQSKEFGLYCKYVNTPEIDGYHRWTELVGEADELTAAGDFEDAKTKIRLAEEQICPAELQGFKWVLTAYRWNALGESKESLRCCEQVTTPTAHPGALFSLAIAHKRTNPELALRNVEAYEQAIGPNHELLEVKANLLEQLGRRSEEIKARETLARISFGNYLPLLRYLVSLPDEEKALMEPLLAVQEDRLGVASKLVTSAMYQDPAGFEFLLGYLSRLAPDAPATQYAKGLRDKLFGEYEEAANLFWQAYQLEPDETQREIYSDAYMEVMQESGQVLEAVRRMPDAKSALDSLLFTHDEGDLELTPEEYEAVVDLYVDRFPEEWDAVERKVTLAIEGKRFAEAQELINRALAALPKQDPTVDSADDDEFDEDEYYRDAFETAAATNLYKQGQLQQAYDVPGDRSDRVQHLARLATRDQRWDDIRQLLAWHRQQAPNDEQVLLVEAQLEKELGNIDAAISRYQRALRKAPKDQRWWRDREYRDLCIDGNRWREYYSSTASPEEAFTGLAEHFVDTHQWHELDKLASLHRVRVPNDPRLALAAADAAWERQELDQYLLHASDALKVDDVDVLAPYQRDEVEHRLLIAKMRLNRWPEALAQANEKLEQKDDPHWLALVNAANGREVDAARYAASSAAKNENGDILYQDEMVGPLFLGAAYRDLQQEYPVPPPYNVCQVVSVSLLDTKRELTQAELEGILGTLKIGAIVTPLETLDERVEKAFAIRFKTGTVWVATGTSKFDKNWKPENATSKLAPHVEGHQAWLAIGTSAWSPVAREQAATVARAITVALAGSSTPAVCLRGRHLWEQYVLLPSRTELLRQWQATGNLWELRRETETMTSSYENHDVPEQRAFTRKLRQAVRRFQQSPGVQFTVWACPIDNPAIGPLEIQLEKVGRNFGAFTFKGKLQDTSLLVPELRSGLSMEIDEHQVLAWQQDNDPPVRRP